MRKKKLNLKIDLIITIKKMSNDITMRNMFRDRTAMPDTDNLIIITMMRTAMTFKM